MLETRVAAYRRTEHNPDQLVRDYAPLVKRIAHHLIGRLPNHILVDDLLQAGMIGLLEAAGKFDASKGASFETYAGIRIRGSMIDEIRRGDWAPRSVHRNARRVTQAIQQVENREGREATDAEIASELGIDSAEYANMLKDSSGARLFSFDEVLDSDDTEEKILTRDDPGLYEVFRQQEFKERLAQAIATLPEREKLVLSLYYDEELNLKEIGAVLEVSESRVSQIHSQAALRLRARLEDWAGSD